MTGVRCTKVQRRVGGSKKALALDVEASFFRRVSFDISVVQFARFICDT